MFPPKIIFALVFALTLLIVALAVTMAGYALAQAVEPEPGGALSTTLLGVGVGCLLLIVIDALLLLLALGVNAVESSRQDNTADDDEQV